MIGAYMVVHGRATDVVYFGPFATLEETWAWLDAHPRVQRRITHLISPDTPAEEMWFMPNA